MIKNLPDAVKRLRLSSAFRDYTNKVTDNITHSSEPLIYIYDDNDTKRSVLTIEEPDNDGFFTARNRSGEELILLAIDNGLIRNRAGGIADSALFNTRLICFIEFKANAFGKSTEAIKNTYIKAISQLEATLELFTHRIRKTGGQIDNTEIKCHIVVASHFPRAQATEQQYIVAFTEKHQIELSFENENEF